MPLSKFSPTDDEDDEDDVGGDGTLIFAGLGGRSAVVPGPHLLPSALCPAVPFRLRPSSRPASAPTVWRSFTNKITLTHSANALSSPQVRGNVEQQQHLDGQKMATVAAVAASADHDGCWKMGKITTNSGVRLSKEVYFRRWQLSLIMA